MGLKLTTDRYSSITSQTSYLLCHTVLEILILLLYFQANIRAKRREQFKGLIDAPPEEISASKFFDPRVR